MNTILKGLKAESTILNALANDTVFATATNKIAEKIFEIQHNEFKAQHGKDLSEEAQVTWLTNAIEDVTFKAFETSANYLLDTDTIKVIRATYNNGGMQIEAVVTRDGVAYDFNTELILAGGYNIQKLHTRYIAKTGLKTVKGGFKDLVKKYTKIDKLNSDIRYENRVLVDYKNDIAENNSNAKYAKKEIKKIEARIAKFEAQLAELTA